MTLLRSLRSRPYHICSVIWIILFTSHFADSCVPPPSIFSIKSPERHLPHLVIHSSEKVAKVRFPLFSYRRMRISYFCHFLQMGRGKEGREATERGKGRGNAFKGFFSQVDVRRWRTRNAFKRIISWALRMNILCWTHLNYTLTMTLSPKQDTFLMKSISLATIFLLNLKPELSENTHFRIQWLEWTKSSKHGL